MIRIRILASVLLVAAPVASYGQGARDTARIAPVVVTATRSPLATTLSPASVSVVSGEELRQQGITTVVDALRKVPGLSVVQTGSYGGATSVFIRGGESKFAKVLVDGVPVNDAGGAFDFSTLTTDNLERIEIVRGPASVLYGSDAMAGVIQLFTRAGAGKAHGDLGVRAGQYGSIDVDGGIRGSNGRYNYSVGTARHATDGIQLFNSRHKQAVSSALVGVRATNADASLSARYTDNNLHYPTNGAGQVVDSNATRRDDRLSLGFDGGYRFSSAVEARLSLASHNTDGVTDDQPDSPGDNAGYYYTTGDKTYRRSADLRVNVVAAGNARLTLGAQVERQWQASSTESNFGPSEFTARRRTTGAYGQLLLAPDPASTVVLGGRFEHNETFGDFFTYSASATRQVTDRTRIRANVGTAFREPTFLENFGSAFVIGNPNLKPEHAMSIDAGIEQVIGRATLGATYFRNSYRDLIDYKYSATAPNYNNIARTKATGVELEGKVDLPSGWRGDAALTYTSTRVIDPGTSTANTALFSPGAQLLRRPLHTLDGGVGYRASRGGVDLRAHRVGVREDVFYAPDFTSRRVTLPSYTRLDLSADANVNPRASRPVTATLRIENLLDAEYTDVAGVNYDFASPGTITSTGYRGAPRRALFGFRIVF